MANKKVRKPNNIVSPFKQFVEDAKRKAKEDLAKLDEDVFMVSFRQVDRNQGQSFHDWEKNSLLADAIEIICGYSSAPLYKQLHDKFKLYDSFPPSNKTDFKYPDHISPDARWASMHIKGEPCLIGHVVNNTFFLVFLDCEHRFWKSELKHT